MELGGHPQPPRMGCAPATPAWEHLKVLHYELRARPSLLLCQLMQEH
jgi:hypothetical protein